jgi:cytochrome c peroxidase
MGGPTVEWKQGRSDAVTGTTVPDGRLPNADSGSVKADVEHLRSIFNRQGFTDREIVALSGAHAVGRCHTEASGYWGPWTNAETTFSNEYFRLLLEEKWTPKKTHLGKVGRHERHMLHLWIYIHNIYIFQHNINVFIGTLVWSLMYICIYVFIQAWTGPAQFENPDGQLMMLPSDLALVRSDEFRPFVALYAKNEEAFFKDFASAFGKVQNLYLFSTYSITVYN